ncbi:MAG TPA: hypothetical protein VHN39_07270 [Phenylobacterium sp.]|jgi:hypothetical protein|nr:hypothetical protein [Phenylobacterium sp.]
MKPPEGESEPRPATRSSRILGLVAAVGFSIAMWAFIAMAILGLILKILGPKDTKEGLAAAGASMSQVFNLDSKKTDTDPPNGSTAILEPDAGPITTLDGRALEPAKSKAPVAREPGTPREAPAQPAPVTGPH